MRSLPDHLNTFPGKSMHGFPLTHGERVIRKWSHRRSMRRRRPLAGTRRLLPSGRGLSIHDRLGFHGLLALFALALHAWPAGAQEPDSSRLYEVGPVVVTAERVRAPLITSTVAVARVSSEQLRTLPLRSVAEALGAVPGLTFVDNDGLGFDPQLTVRGFYGGGEAEYVVVLLDGRPLNGLEGGLVDWDLIPLSAVESIEVVRGGASSLYGDAAVGGVINLVTARGGEDGVRAEISGGEFGTLRGSFNLNSAWEGLPVSVFGALRRLDGFREHAAREAGSAGASFGLVERGTGQISLSTLHHWRDFEEPGPLTAEDISNSRSRVHPFYQFDGTQERLHRLALDARWELGTRSEASAYLAGEYRALAATRTLPLSPEFVDTKERVLSTARLLGSAQLGWGPELLLGQSHVLVGADWSAGRLDNEYHQVLVGGVREYEQGTGERGELDARGAGARLAVGGFARYELRPAAAVRITTGARLDWIADSFEPLGPSGGEALRNSHLALSPQVGINLRYLRTAGQEGHLFANAGRSFKAPTPDQLFDQRSIPVPYEPYRLTISNAGLDPQRGVSVEAGVYHRARLVPGALSGSLSMAAYQVDMEDELDVDLETFRYVNIGRSRHRGVEAGVDIDRPGRMGAYANYTLQAVTFRYGDHEGNALKAIPRHSLGAGLRAGNRSGLAASVAANSAWGIYLDDANTTRLPGYTRVDARLSYPVAGARLYLEVFNLLDREYSTTGYLDPAGTGTAYLFPAAGRMLQVGLSSAL